MAAASLADIVRLLGGELWDGGRRANVPAPGHSRRDRSVSLLLDGARIVVHSFGGAAWTEVLDDLRARGLVDAEGRLAGALPGGASAARPPRPERIRRAREIWDQGRPLAGSPAERHLHLRGVRGDVAGDLRFHPALASAAYVERGVHRPALLAGIRAPDGEICGVEATYLAPDGRRARVATARKTLGARPAGSAVRLAQAATEMLVGEGVFSALSAAERFGLPAWALLAAGNLAAWVPSAGVRRVVIAADRGPTGEAAAARLAARLAGLGVAARIELPPAPHEDWNDAAGALAQGGEEEGPG